MSNTAEIKELFASKFEQIWQGRDKHFTTSWRDVMEVAEAEKLSDTHVRVVYRFPVQADYVNPGGGFHGGMQAAFLDVGTSCLMLLIAKEGFWRTSGTTRTLNMTYLRPAFVGDVVRMECKTVNVGKRMALLKGTIVREKDGALISTCEHNKFNNDPGLEKA